MRFLIIILILSFNTLKSQNVLIETPYQILMSDTWNYISISVDGESCRKLQLLTDSEVKKGPGCSWEIKPLPYQNCRIQPFILNGSDTIFFKKKLIPTSKVDVLLSSIPKAISKKYLLKLERIISFAYKGYYGCIDVPASSFKVVGMRNEEIIFAFSNQEDQIESKLKSLFSELNSGDTLYFFDIKHNLPNYQNIREFDVTIR